MKKLIVLFSIAALLPFTGTNGMLSPAYQGAGQDTVHLMVSSELSGLVDKWISEYTGLNPEIAFRKDLITAEESNPVLAAEGVTGIVTEEYLRSVNNNLWTMVVARDVIVPVISSENPFTDEISSHGISPGQFAGIYTEAGMLTWGAVLGNGDETTVNCYCPDNESLNCCIAQFLQTENLRGSIIKVEDNSHLIESVGNDKYGIGFCRLSGLIDYEKNSVREGLSIVPIDINGNGILEHNENIYSCLNDLNRGIWIGKYPGSLCRNIHVVSGKAPVNTTETGFITWVLSGGQHYISEAGFSELIPGERQPKIQSVSSVQAVPLNDSRSAVNSARVLFILGTVIAGVVLVYIMFRIFSSGKKSAVQYNRQEAGAFSLQSLEAPAGLLYDKSHTWVFMEREGAVRVGVDDFLQHVTGKITRIKIKGSGTKIKKGDPVMSLIQNGKQIDINSPVSGLITETNQILATNPGVINRSPYNDGWLYTVQPDNWLRESGKYLMGASYPEWIKNEFTRLKDFLVTAYKSKGLGYETVILQDGGELRDNMLENYGPDIWEEFQTMFIDKAV